jgi:hypothetical protein
MAAVGVGEKMSEFSGANPQYATAAFGRPPLPVNHG